MPKLTPLTVKNARPGRHADGGGLYLLVKPTGAKSWVLRVVMQGRRRDFGLGSVSLAPPPPGIEEVPIGRRKVLSLAEARQKAEEGRRYAKNGIDPAVEWAKISKIIPTFEKHARAYHDAAQAGWRNGKHGAQWLSTLEAHAFPVIGAMRVDEIEASDVQRVLMPIWLSLPETARRVRQRVLAVLDDAHAAKLRDKEAPRKAVVELLKKTRQPKRGPGHAAIPYAKLPGLMEVLRASDATPGRMALMFTILTAARSGETRGMTWDEVDLENARWDIPGSRMKAGEDHSVPLSSAAVAILEEAKGLITGRKGEPVFPGLKSKPLSDATMAKALSVAGGGGYTVHGMRSTFRDWVAERTTFPGDWAEAALAHTIPNKTEAAYRRTKFFDQRKAMMADWAAFLDEGSNVVALSEKRA